MKKYDTLGFDLVAMTIDDLVANGFEPAAISNILDVDNLNHQTVDELMRGLHDAARFSNIVVTGGEIAELGSRIGGYGTGMHCNWCATGIGMLHRNLKQPFNGFAITPGDAIISLYNPGLRSNGFSLARTVLAERFGEKWHTRRDPKSKQLWGEALLTPSLIYTPAIVRLMDKNIPLHGVAHITGGGVVDNLGRLLKHNKLGAKLDNLFQPDLFLTSLMEIGKISSQKAYQYWNMGNGMLVILPKRKVTSALSTLRGLGAYRANVAGIITEEPIISIDTDNTTLVYTSYDTK